MAENRGPRKTKKIDRPDYPCCEGTVHAHVIRINEAVVPEDYEPPAEPTPSGDPDGG